MEIYMENEGDVWERKKRAYLTYTSVSLRTLCKFWLRPNWPFEFNPKLYTRFVSVTAIVYFGPHEQKVTFSRISRTACGVPWKDVLPIPNWPQSFDPHVYKFFVGLFIIHTQYGEKK